MEGVRGFDDHEGDNLGLQISGYEEGERGDAASESHRSMAQKKRAGPPMEQNSIAKRAQIGDLDSNPRLSRQQQLLDEHKKRAIMHLLLEARNSNLPRREMALERLAAEARNSGAGHLLDKILPLLLGPKLEDQELHLLVKAIDQVLLYTLDSEQVRPFVPKVLVAIQPLLMDEDSHSFEEGGEIILNLSKLAGLEAMLAAISPQTNDTSEYVRCAAARAFGVVASALGIPAILPSLKGFCQSKESWRVRHTGIRMVEQIAVRTGCAVRPHLRSLLMIIKDGLAHKDLTVMRITALSLAALASAAEPYGFECFHQLLLSLRSWSDVRLGYRRGEVLAALLKLLSSILRLMDPIKIIPDFSIGMYEVMPYIPHLFEDLDDDETKEIALTVLKQCMELGGHGFSYSLRKLLHDMLQNMWGRRMALDRRNYRLLVGATVVLANKVGVKVIRRSIAECLQEYSGTYRQMVIETIDKAMASVEAFDTDARMEEVFIDMDYLFLSSF